jgi:hypothetical protein
MVEETDWLNDRGDTLLDLAEVLRLARRVADAQAALAEAVRLFEQKGNEIAGERARSVLAELQAAT